MLKFFRKKIVAKIVLWGLVIIVVPAFVMWGGASMSRSKDKGPSYVGILNNKKVTFDELYGALLGVRSQIILNYYNQPQALEALLSNKPILAKLAWDRILMLDQARKMGIKASDKEVIEMIQKHPLFVRNSVFDDRFYSYLLRNTIGLEARAFEETVRDNIILQKLTAQLTRDVSIPDDELRSTYEKEFEKLKIAYILLEPKAYTDDIKIDEAAAKDFFDKHKTELVVKSQLKGAVPDRIATFEESKGTIINYLKEVEARKTLKTKADDIRKKISDRIEKKGETFGKAASELGLAVKDTAPFSVNDKVEEIGDIPIVADAASKLKLFELSQAVELNKGWIIFEVVDRKPADQEAFKKEKEEYAKKVRDRKSNIIMEKWLRDLEGKAKLEIKLEEIEKYYR